MVGNNPAEFLWTVASIANVAAGGYHDMMGSSSIGEGGGGGGSGHGSGHGGGGSGHGSEHSDGGGGHGSGHGGGGSGHGSEHSGGGGGHDSGHGGGGAAHGGHHHGGCSAMHGDYTIKLHVLAIFIFLAASFVGTAIPVAGKYVPALRMNPFVVVLAKCISTGVVMAVALLTMINHSWHSFQEECIPKALQPDTYDAYTLLFVLVSALLMHMLDVLLDVLIQNWSACQCAREDPSEVVGPAEYEMENDPIRGPCGMKGCGSQSGEICEMTGCCQNRGNAGEKSLTGARRIVAALLMEFGLTLHSVFLGLSVGIGNDADTKSLLVALSFHQLFEGLALGSRLADASMHAGAELALALIFSFSVPVGTAIGLISVKGSNVSMTGPTFVTLQAVVNAIGGGILLYIGFGLLLNDFPADLQRCAGMRTSHRGWRIFAMFLAVWAGAGIMALLANLH